MKNLVQYLSQYAAYHRDKRNIATHFVGIPMIVFAVILLLSRPLIELGGIAMTPAVPAAALAALFYLRLDIRFGITMTILLGMGVWAAMPIAGSGTLIWLAWGIGLFVLGWIIQFIGHYYEGKKPAFIDDLVGLIIGPLFVIAEIAFKFGLRKEVEQAIEAQVGPCILRDMSKHPA